MKPGGLIQRDGKRGLERVMGDGGALEPRPEELEGASQVKSWGNCLLGGKNIACQGPGAGVSLPFFSGVERKPLWLSEAEGGGR